MENVTKIFPSFFLSRAFNNWLNFQIDKSNEIEFSTFQHIFVVLEQHLKFGEWQLCSLRY